MNRVLVLGSANTDLTVQAPRLPAAGETVGGGEFAAFYGGKGANQALAALRCGLEVELIARIGTDPFGRNLAQHLLQSGLPEEGLFLDPDLPGGVALIVVDLEGNNQIVVAPGSNGSLSPEDVNASEHLFTPGSVFLTQLEIPLETVTRGLELAKSRDMTTILNPAPFVPLDSRILHSTDILTPNESEAAGLTEADPEDRRKVLSGLQGLLDQGPGNVLLTMGSEGVQVVGRDGCQHIPAHPVHPVDTVGAGDAFNGVLAAGLAAGLPLLKAARLAAAAGALCTTRRGAQESLPGREEIQDLCGLSFDQP
jgi:ribokinase